MVRPTLLAAILAACMAGSAMAQTQGQAADSPASPAAPKQLTADQVKAVQARLTKDGLFKGQADGIYGESTTAAVLAFQRRENLPPTGALDDPTLAAIERSASASVGTPEATANAAALCPPATAGGSGGAGGLNDACGKLAAKGFEQIEGLYKAKDGTWVALAKQGDRPMRVWVDPQGQVGSKGL